MVNMAAGRRVKWSIAKKLQQHQQQQETHFRHTTKVVRLTTEALAVMRKVVVAVVPGDVITVMGAKKVATPVVATPAVVVTTVRKFKEAQRRTAGVEMKTAAARAAQALEVTDKTAAVTTGAQEAKGTPKQPMLMGTPRIARQRCKEQNHWQRRRHHHLQQ